MGKSAASRVKSAWSIQVGIYGEYRRPRDGARDGTARVV
jgi:hypothetical protein